MRKKLKQTEFLNGTQVEGARLKANTALSCRIGRINATHERKTVDIDRHYKSVDRLDISRNQNAMHV